jgi:hypothetical protein
MKFESKIFLEKGTTVSDVIFYGDGHYEDFDSYDLEEDSYFDVSSLRELKILPDSNSDEVMAIFHVEYRTLDIGLIFEIQLHVLTNVPINNFKR